MASNNLIGQTLAGRYEIRGVVGAGGMGTVYRAMQLALRREVAVKVLPSALTDQPGYLERFNREAELAARMEHPNIVPVYDYGRQDDVTFIVMRLITGKTLIERMQRYHYDVQSRPSLREIANLLTSMAGALDYAHEKGVIHRDIKPGNIMFDERGTPYISDFGIAQLVEASTSLTQTGALIGTPAYMAPEMWRDESVTPTIDQYALAVVIYELLTGRRPFEADTPYVLLTKHLNETPPPPHTLRPGTPEAISDVLSRALAKKAEDRFETVGAFATAFDGAAAQVSEAFTGFFALDLSAIEDERKRSSPISKARDYTTGAEQEKAATSAAFPQPAVPAGYPPPRPITTTFPPPAAMRPQRSSLPLLIGVAALVLAGVGAIFFMAQPGELEMPGLIQPVIDNMPLILILGLAGVGVFFLGSAAIERMRPQRPPSNDILPPGDGDLHLLRHRPSERLDTQPPTQPDDSTQPEIKVDPVMTPLPTSRDATTTFTGLNQGLWIAHYRLEKRLDKGERSRVYHGHDTRLDRPVALKALNAYSADSERSERFKREAQLLGKLHHAHIVPLYDYGVLNDINYTVMPLLTGGSLEDKLRDGLSPAEALAVGRPLGEALDYIHSNGVIHRDLKAGNILFGEQNKLYLVDFGIAKILDTGQQALTAVGQVVGTPETMPPEQWVGEKVTPAADQYTFAALVYRMLTRELPFKADSPYRYMLQHLRETPPLPSARNPNLPGAVDAVLLKALAKDPAERYPSINRFVDALEQALRGVGIGRKEGHIFLSYSRADGDYARSVAGYLRGHGFQVWMDDKIEPSEEWWPNIVQALDSCCAFIVIMSPSSAESRWVARETLLADEKRKPAFPLLLRGKAFPIYVATQYADVSDGSMPNHVFLRRLAGAIGKQVAEG
jgi:serine/threonine protein kinase